MITVLVPDNDTSVTVLAVRLSSLVLGRGERKRTSERGTSDYRFGFPCSLFSRSRTVSSYIFSPVLIDIPPPFPSHYLVRDKSFTVVFTVVGVGEPVLFNPPIRDNSNPSSHNRRRYFPGDYNAYHLCLARWF